MRLIHVDEFAEDLTDAAQLPGWAEQYLAEERTWWRLLRGTGAVTEAEARAELLSRLEDRAR
ncbi:hypothetical protein [Mycobacteroides chelonae]|uniref:hypothetical protein n=1 Tax=Mycobacteroides chelonae TaxID=1774 RepID=UPI000D6A1D59|nr:hypothetical protein [Mycobacteroides chelonae]